MSTPLKYYVRARRAACGRLRVEVRITPQILRAREKGGARGLNQAGIAFGSFTGDRSRGFPRSRQLPNIGHAGSAISLTNA
jgi:hypothetical protein